MKRELKQSLLLTTLTVADGNSECEKPKFVEFVNKNSK